MTNTPIGISGIAVHVPPFRVDLEEWCAWSGADWNKIKSVVGTGFRLPGSQQSVYTMAANAVLRLIEQNDVDASTVRFLGLGTESSTDNSAGAIIAKGMVNDALRAQGKNPLSRHCEVPEFKHACLGGIYALKNAIRFLNTDGKDAKAIVVCSDIAIYEAGTSGEPTQGAGAVAILLEHNPQIATFDLTESGSASDYRGVDFRKPIQYRNGSGETLACSNTPVFNGRYSASCYIDEVQQALKEMYGRRQFQAADYVQEVAAVFMHRPFKRMPENGWGMAWLFALATDAGAGRQTLSKLCAQAGIEVDDLLAEVNHQPAITDLGVENRISEEAFPKLSKVLRSARNSAEWGAAVADKLTLGATLMEELGNMYSGALPAWFAAGLEEAAANNVDLNGKELLLIGYGSGDAAEALPVHMVKGWEDAAARINLTGALSASINLTHKQYDALQAGRNDAQPDFSPSNEFIVDRVGSETADSFQDKGIEYYRFIT
jgi:hydroxymethylglutaryl-CoA synthase